MHAGLADDLGANRIDLVFAAGPLMKSLFDALPGADARRLARQRRACSSRSSRKRSRAGDIVIVKGSNGSRMSAIVGASQTARGGARSGSKRAEPVNADLARTILSHFQPLNLFRYITFRTGGATATALFFVFFFGPRIIAALRIKQGKGQPIRLDGPQSHLLTKKGTPTMGGLMILSGLVVSTLLWANLRNHYVWIVLFVTTGFGLIGFYDDYLKVTKQTAQGLFGAPAPCDRGRHRGASPVSP